MTFVGVTTKPHRTKAGLSPIPGTTYAGRSI